MDFLDPDALAQLYVMQWMHENGLHDALRALEKQLGRLYDDALLPEASQLLQLVWRHVEEKLLQQEQDEQEEGPTGGEEAPTTTTTATTTTTTTTIHGNDKSASSRAARRRHQEEALQLLRAGCEDYAGRAVVSEVPPEVHRANVIAVRIVPGQDCVITAAGDGCVRCIRYGPGASGASGTAAGAAPGGGDNAGSGSDPEVVWETRLGSAALLSLALHPGYSLGLPLVAVGGMDGRVTVLHGSTGAVLATAQAHTKYVLRVAWGGATAAAAADPAPGVVAPTGTAPAALGATDGAAAGAAEAEAEAGGGGTASSNDGSAANARDGGGGAKASPQGTLLVTASTDETIAVHTLDLDLDADADADVDSGLDGGVAARSGAAATWRLTTLKQIPYGTAVTDAAFLRDGRTLAVAIRGSNYLRLLDTRELVRQVAPSAVAGSGATAAVGGGAVPERLVNLNELGDDHVSFTAKQLVPSPCGKYLLVCTDTPRLLVLRTTDWSHLRHIFGLPVDQFPQPAAAWHRDSHYIYVSGAGAQLCVFHLGSGRLAHSATHHKVNVRDVDYDPHRNLLATCSFDKTVKLTGP